MTATTLPLESQFGNTVQHFSQIVVNQGSITSFSVHNPSTTEAITVDVQLYFARGNPLAQEELQIPPRGTESVAFGQAGVLLARGWAKLTSSGEFVATEFFQLFLGELKPRVGVLPSTVADEIKFFGFVNDRFKSGIAVNNPDETTPTEVTVRLRDKPGQQLGNEKKFMRGPLQQEAAFLNEEKFFGAALKNYEGTVEVTASPVPVALLSLIQDKANGTVATVSVITPAGTGEFQEVRVLLFPFATNRFGFDTGIVISNITEGYTPREGTCTIQYHGFIGNDGPRTPPNETSTVIEAGEQLAFNLSAGNPVWDVVGAPDFQGYIIAVCGFEARGYALITDGAAGIPTLAQGYLAELLPTAPSQGRIPIPPTIPAPPTGPIGGLSRNGVNN